MPDQAPVRTAAVTMRLAGRRTRRPYIQKGRRGEACLARGPVTARPQPPRVVTYQSVMYSNRSTGWMTGFV
jgi:hypothetical protein